MPTYKVTGINVGSFNIGEADKVLTIFSAERGLIRAVAKGARKPGSKIAGRADLLSVNSLLLSTGRTLDIVTQAESLETFPKLRQDLLRLSFGFYYAELTQQFGHGLSEESKTYFAYLCKSLRLLSNGHTTALMPGCIEEFDGGLHPGQTDLKDPALKGGVSVERDDVTWMCLQFELGLLEMVGYKPELTYCVMCRAILSDYQLGAFAHDLGGVVCRRCCELGQASWVAETHSYQPSNLSQIIQVTPLVWKNLALASHSGRTTAIHMQSPKLKPAIQAAHQLIKSYIEYKAGRPMRSLDLLKSLGTP
ncbi:MAG: DNA repair protein RecO [Candidatus Melainabacteria bacterium]|nr:DNA repair protein RecO [Candidatus Melainabacteria bacterium]